MKKTKSKPKKDEPLRKQVAIMAEYHAVIEAVHERFGISLGVAVQIAIEMLADATATSHPGRWAEARRRLTGEVVAK